ncbi:hypothetical protein C8R46DRAFT_1046929 [Mycena filopes]|nr:hypothetical protein C8R46DRAFT_1046929 [Mycena filopes]
MDVGTSPKREMYTALSGMIMPTCALRSLRRLIIDAPILGGTAWLDACLSNASLEHLGIIFLRASAQPPLCPRVCGTLRRLSVKSWDVIEDIPLLLHACAASLRRFDLTITRTGAENIPGPTGYGRLRDAVQNLPQLEHLDFSWVTSSLRSEVHTGTNIVTAQGISYKKENISFFGTTWWIRTVNRVFTTIVKPSSSPEGVRLTKWTNWEISDTLASSSAKFPHSETDINPTTKRKEYEGISATSQQARAPLGNRRVGARLTETSRLLAPTKASKAKSSRVNEESNLVDRKAQGPSTLIRPAKSSIRSVARSISPAKPSAQEGKPSTRPRQTTLFKGSLDNTTVHPRAPSSARAPPVSQASPVNVTFGSARNLLPDSEAPARFQVDPPLRSSMATETQSEAAPTRGDDLSTHPNPGMRRGYAMSEMADLQREYLKEGLEESSLFLRVNSVISKKALDARDILDRGNANVDPRPRFCVKPDLLTRVDLTIGDMQSVLKRAASLVPGKLRHFVIDPHNTLVPVLQGSNNLDEIHVSWLAINRRMELAQKFMDKYEMEYQVSENDVRPASPATTDAEIHNRWPVTKATSTQLMYLFDKVPHHADQLPRGYDRDTGDLFEHLRALRNLQNAFPNRPSANHPSTVYYSAAGEKLERPHSDKSPSEISTNSDELLEDSESVKRDASRGKHGTSSSLPQDARAYQFAYQQGKAPSSVYASMNERIPYKKGNEFFAMKSSLPSPRDHRIPGPDLPNVLHGMASSMPYGLSADSISQGMKQHRKHVLEDPRYRQWTGTAGPKSTRFTPIVEEHEEERLHAEGGRDQPQSSARAGFGHAEEDTGLLHNTVTKPRSSKDLRLEMDKGAPEEEMMEATPLVIMEPLETLGNHVGHVIAITAEKDRGNRP